MIVDDEIPLGCLLSSFYIRSNGVGWLWHDAAYMKVTGMVDLMSVSLGRCAFSFFT